MRTNITIARRHGSKEFVLVCDPSVPIAEQSKALSEARASQVHKEFAEVQIWDSHAGLQRTHKFLSPNGHKAEQARIEAENKAHEAENKRLLEEKKAKTDKNKKAEPKSDTKSEQKQEPEKTEPEKQEGETKSEPLTDL